MATRQALPSFPINRHTDLALVRRIPRSVSASRLALLYAPLVDVPSAPSANPDHPEHKRRALSEERCKNPRTQIQPAAVFYALVITADRSLTGLHSPSNVQIPAISATEHVKNGRESLRKCRACSSIIAASKVLGNPLRRNYSVKAKEQRMKPKTVGMLLLSIYLIVVGVVGLGGITLGSLHIVIPILAIAAGVCLLIGK